MDRDRLPLYVFGGGVGLFALALLVGRKAGFLRIIAPREPVHPVGKVQEAIVREATRRGLDPRVALMFADQESRFKAGAVGDRDWPFRERKDGLTQWEFHVKNNPTFANNPWRDDPSRWVSYGVYQLLTPFHLQKINPNADPRILLDLNTNVRVGVGIIKRLSDKYGGDILKMRLFGYVACLPGRCSADTATKIAERTERFAAKWDIYLKPNPVARARALSQGIPA